MTSLIILILVGGACLAVTAWALWRTPATRDYLRRIFGAGGDR
ncbi:hypothetical protein [uncultured Microbacterium sp.]|nr:hypothetical protein [uncultured Microbacterium sp.]